MKYLVKSIIPVILTIFLLASMTALAQEPVIINDSVFSPVLHEQRRIKICLPEEYRPGSGKKYDVVYILDGEMHFDDFIYISRFAGKQGLIPPLILISLPNNYNRGGCTRDRDFVPGNTTGTITGSGAVNFIAFLKDELMPYLRIKLPAGGDNTLFGHSLAGLFTMYVLLKEPDLFENYFCSDPAFPWNNRQILSMAEEGFKKTAALKKNLLIVGVEETYRNVGIAKMDSLLQARSPEGLRWKTSVYPDENHMSVRLKGIYDGLKYLYHGYNAQKMVEFHPNNGALLEGKPAPVFLNGSFPEVHYTTNGSEPDTSSERAPQKIEIFAPARVTVKWLGENKKYTTSSKGDFELSKIWPALPNSKDFKRGGLQYAYYEGKWEKLPDFSTLKPVKTGIADSLFSLEKLPAVTDFACVFEGYLRIDLEGYYGFAICSSDGSRFFINGREIISNDGLHASEWYKSYVVPLQKGFYPVMLEYFQRTGNRHLDMIYIAPITYETVKMTFGTMYHK